MKLRQWYRFDAKADGPSADLYIYSDIGYSYWDDTSVTAKSFIDDLNALPAGVQNLNVHINSLGGDVFEAVAITNALRAWGGQQGRIVTTMIEGIAASAATIVAMGGTKIIMADNALMMVHNPWTIAIGNAAEMRKTADALDAVRNTIVATYKWHSSLSDEELVALLDAETWMDADAAIAKGFATEKVAGLVAADALESRVLARLTVPDAFKAKVDGFLAKPTPAPAAAAAADVLRICREGDCLDLAEGFIAASATVDQVTAKVTETTNARAQAAAQAATLAAQATARATEIRGICAIAKFSELADGYIVGGMSPDAIRAQLTTITARMDKVEIDGHLDLDHGATRGALNRTAIYKNFNKR